MNQATDTLYATKHFDGNGNPGSTVSVINGATRNATVTTGRAATGATVTAGSGPADLPGRALAHSGAHDRRPGSSSCPGPRRWKAADCDPGHLGPCARAQGAGPGSGCLASELGVGRSTLYRALQEA